jgi:hypothetical protein
MSRSTLSIIIALGATAFTSGGCFAPWSGAPATPMTQAATTSATVAAGNDSKTPRPMAQASEAVTSIVPAAATIPSADLAGVLDKLQEVRDIDPAAEQVLLRQLRTTPTESWPLVAEQFRASLAYREQLKAASTTPSEQAEPVVPAGILSRPLSTSGAQPHGEAVGFQADVTINADESTRQQPTAPPWGDDAQAHQAVAMRATPPDASSVFQAGYSGVGDAGDALPTEDRKGDEIGRDWQQWLKLAEDDLSQRVAPSPTTTAEVHQHVSLRILRLLTGETEKALEPIPHIAPMEQDYWSRQLFALATYLDHHSLPDDKRRAAASVTHLDEAAGYLRELGSLSIRNLSFCKKVFGYGAVEPYPVDSFSPGEHVSLYVEVENFHSQPTEKGFCTSLGSTYEITNQEGARVGGGEVPDVNDCCRSRRRDFHIEYGLTLPEKLAPGRYQLQLVIKDRQSDKIGHSTAAFEIRGPVP